MKRLHIIPLRCDYPPDQVAFRLENARLLGNDILSYDTRGLLDPEHLLFEGPNGNYYFQKRYGEYCWTVM